MVEDSEVRGREDPWLHMGILQGTHESEFIPKNSNYISRYKLRDLVITTNDNLRQYVKVYFELCLRSSWCMN
jgi:hypothetical protein